MNIITRIVSLIVFCLGIFNFADAQTKQTQVILKVQDVTFAPENQTKVVAPYIDKESIMIPDNLHGSHKWIMFEGPVLENDKIAYRIYADSRHRFDIYAKKVSDLVMDTVSWNYHGIMDWGSDILKVGNSLGMGSPGIYYKDSIYTLSDWSSKKVEITENGDLRSAVKTTFNDLKIGEHTFTVVEEWSIEAGNFYCEIDLKVKDGKLPDGMHFASGIVKHLPQATVGQSGNALYAFTYGEQSFHHQNMGMAVMASTSYDPREVQDELSHLYIFQNSASGVKYRFMAQWAEGMGSPSNSMDFSKEVEKACIGIE